MKIDPQLLARVPLLHGFAEDDIKALAARVRLRRLAADERLFDKGDAGDSIFIVLSGGVRIELPPAHEGEPHILLKELRSGDFFGEMALFERAPRTAAARAASDSLLGELSYDELADFLQGSGRAVMAMLAEMSRRLRSTNELLSTHVARDVNREIDERLTWGQKLADRVARWNGSWKFIAILLALTAVWVFVNRALHTPFDAYPYQFFNLFLAILVALQGPLIVMSQNRQNEKDRLNSEAGYRVNLKNEVGIEQILAELARLRAEFGMPRES